MPWASEPEGPLAAPGEYTVSLAVRKDGKLEEVAGPKTFTVKSLPQGKETSQNLDAVVAFQRKAGELYRAVSGASALTGELNQRITHLKAAIPDTPAAGEVHEQRLRRIKARLDDLVVALNGDRTVASRSEPTRTRSVNVCRRTASNPCATAALPATGRARKSAWCSHVQALSS